MVMAMMMVPRSKSSRCGSHEKQQSHSKNLLHALNPIMKIFPCAAP